MITTKRKPVSEKTFRTRFVKFLKETQEKKYFLYLPIMQTSYKSAPDFLLCVNGIFISVELKKEGGKATPLQLDMRNNIAKADGLAYILYPDKFEEFKQSLLELLKFGISRKDQEL